MINNEENSGTSGHFSRLGQQGLTNGKPSWLTAAREMMLRLG
jgi:hypothetical protein